MSRKKQFAVLVTLLIIVVPAVDAAEITSNGNGGGDWSNPATWLGKKVPGPDDDAVIQKGDIVDFDRNDDGKVTCQKLFIDPRGSFRLKPGHGKITCCLAGPIDSRGLIQLDATKSASDLLELRMVGSDSQMRTLKLLKGAALVLRGRAELPDGRRNVRFTSPKIGEQKEDLECWAQALKGGVLLDLQRADLANVIVRADDLDNTGARTNERVHIVDCRFNGRGRVWFTRCDTPVIRNNRFEGSGAKSLEHAGAILVSECPLPEVRGNTVHGFGYAVQGAHLDGATIVDNRAEKCIVGYHLGYGRSNSLYRNQARDCERAFDFMHTQMATLEDNKVDGAKVVVRSLCSTVQVASLDITNLAKDGLAVLYDADAEHRCNGNVVLINCNIRADQVKLKEAPKLPAGAPLPVVALSCVVVSVPDAPPSATVDVRTVNPMPPLPAGAVDPNVRNVPAPLAKGLTPLVRPAGTPRDALPIMVKTWAIDPAGKTFPAPEYEIRVQTPDGRVGKNIRVKPQDSWFRPKADDPTPTVEVK